MAEQEPRQSDKFYAAKRVVLARGRFNSILGFALVELALGFLFAITGSTLGGLFILTSGIIFLFVSFRAWALNSLDKSFRIKFNEDPFVVFKTLSQGDNS